MGDMNEIQARLAGLSTAYAAQLPGKLEQIEQAWHLINDDQQDEDGLSTLYRRVHSLTGTGKTFGFPLLSDVARKLESYLKPIAELNCSLSDEQKTYIRLLLSELRQVAMHTELIAPAAWLNITKTEPGHVCESHVFILGDDHLFSEELKIQLNHFGYQVSLFDNLEEFRQAMMENRDVVVLMDISSPAQIHEQYAVIKEIQASRSVFAPVVLLTSLDNVEARLDAVRTGSIAYLIKPINISHLIDKLDALTSNQTPAPYRVLIIDDSEALTDYYGMVLEQAGMVVETTNDPMSAMEHLNEFNPDLILIDLYMPQCDGVELAKLIRQMERFVSIPIVFLSAENDLSKQLFAMGMGGDDFLTKPIEPLHLISSVLSRIQRSLELRSFMVRDSLTGLLNHSTIKDQLKREVALAKRQGSPLSFAMLDIDHFKQVNDTYGHATGDHVIKSLSRLLKQKLREAEMIGRYGGEEFAVILSHTNAQTAVNVMDSIRRDFSQIPHFSSGKEFFVTFSCGIADVAHFNDHAELCNAADKALYLAKHAGRNLVALASDIQQEDELGEIQRVA